MAFQAAGLPLLQAHQVSPRGATIKLGLTVKFQRTCWN